MSKPLIRRGAAEGLALRRSLGKFATGVTVVTCTGADGRPRGITANSFSSVSLAPPLVLWNIATVSNSLESFLNAEFFAIHVLGAGQQQIAVHFARSDHAAFEGVGHSISADGVPILPDVLARFDCRAFRTHEAGDHFVIIGEVHAHRHAAGEPLLFFDGAYRAGD